MPITLEVPIIEPISAVPLLVVCVFVLFDVIVGLCKAFATHSYESEEMRAGLWHKSAIIGVTVLAYALQIVTAMMDFSVVGIEAGTSVPITLAVTAYIVLMEVGSILESIVTINPELGGRGLMRHFGGWAPSAADPDATTELPAVGGTDE